ncbi:MAG: nitrous oxide reductase accessory protein NosL [Proteobacteria bacterium]|nr:nitrous oxide reductase accessory protein NosL [Pseudomonadota bacterium]
MKRRDFLGALPAATAGPYLGSLLGGGLAGLGLTLGGCSGEPTSGPVEIKWDRETCPRCRMVISDKRFAAQLRDPNRKVWKFDDIGCLVFWLAHQQFNEASTNTEYWVADYRSGSWLDARKAHYLHGKKSPMGYHYAALAEPEAGVVDYPEMKKRIIALGK